jgi:hypothetical protein
MRPQENPFNSGKIRHRGYTAAERSSSLDRQAHATWVEGAGTVPISQRPRSSGRPFIFGLVVLLAGLTVVSLVYRPVRTNSERKTEKDIDPFTDEMPDSPPLHEALNLVDTLRQARLAARAGRTSEVRLLVQQGLNVDKNLGLGHTMLMLACLNGQSECVRYLISQHAHALIADAKGNTALSLAAENGNIAIVDLLLKTNPKLRMDTLMGRRKEPLLITAAGYGNYRLTEYLVTHGANVKSWSKYGHTPLIAAVEFGHLDVARYLLAHGADVNAADKAKDTPLSVARKMQVSKYVWSSHPLDMNVMETSPTSEQEKALQHKTAAVMVDMLEKAGAHE